MITLEKVSFHYDQHTAAPIPALREVSLTVDPDTLLGVAGPSGSGKTTLLQLMGGLLAPTEGVVRVDGEDLASSSKARQRVCLKAGLVFQFPERQLFETTVFDDVAFGPKNLGLDGSSVEERVREALARVGLELDAIGTRPPLDLSFGEMRRVALAGVLALRPKILLLDEPTAGMDERGRRELERLILSLHEQGSGVVIASHDLGFLSGIVREFVFIDEGRAVLHGRATDVLFDVDRIRAMGLSVPFAADLLSTLRAKGWVVDVESMRESDVAEGLIRAADRRRKGERANGRKGD